MNRNLEHTQSHIDYVAEAVIYVAKMRERVTQQIRSGKNQAEIAKFMETEYQWAPNSLQQQWSVPGFMTELK